MKTKDAIKAIKVKGARVFARIPFGIGAFKSIEINKKPVVDALQKLDGELELGCRVSKSGHVYFSGLTKKESDAHGLSLEDANTELEAMAEASGS